MQWVIPTSEINYGKSVPHFKDIYKENLTSASSSHFDNRLKASDSASTKLCSSRIWTTNFTHIPEQLRHRFHNNATQCIVTFAHDQTIQGFKPHKSLISYSATTPLDIPTTPLHIHSKCGGFQAHLALIPNKRFKVNRWNTPQLRLLKLNHKNQT